jgi:hypothetical protein
MTELPAMPWKCPACGININHHEGEFNPRRSTSYRCHSCRLELVLDPATNKLTVAPFPLDGETVQKSQVT